jgi:hypothetical protein
MTDQIAQRGDGIDTDAFYQGSLMGICGGDVNCLKALVFGHLNHGQYAVSVPEATIQGTLSQEYRRFFWQANSAGTRKDSYGH